MWKCIIYLTEDKKHISINGKIEQSQIGHTIVDFIFKDEISSISDIKYINICNNNIPIISFDYEITITNKRNSKSDNNSNNNNNNNKGNNKRELDYEKITQKIQKPLILTSNENENLITIEMKTHILLSSVMKIYLERLNDKKFCINRVTFTSNTKDFMSVCEKAKQIQ